MDNKNIVKTKVTKQIKIIKKIHKILGDKVTINVEELHNTYVRFLFDIEDGKSILVHLDYLDTIINHIHLSLIHGDIFKLINKYKQNKPNVDLPSEMIDSCECGGEIEYDRVLLQNVCNTCGLYENRHQIFHEYESTNSVSSPDKRVQVCLDDIQGKRPILMPKKEWTKLLKKRDIECTRYVISISGNKTKTSINVNLIECATIRRWLAQIKLSKYNDNVPYIRKLLFGIEPYQLTQEEVDMVLFYYPKMNDKYKSMFSVGDKKSSDPHAAYMVGKILEFILPPEKWDILKCIHMQSMKTIVIRDKKWEQVCLATNLIRYKPTLSKYYN